MASSSLAPTGLTASKAALQQQHQQQALLNASSSSTSAIKPAAPVTRVAIRDGKMIGINDYIYLSPAWAPGFGEPYMIARVMEFVTAASSRSGAAALASSSGTLQVRANVFLRMRDISLRSTNDPRLLVATMHSDVFSLENVRGICEVRHRDLIGHGVAPDITQWKKKEDHFYYYQLYDRYIHRFYDVIPTEKVQNAPQEVLDTLRQRYSFVVAEQGMINDLTDALRGCAVCHRWASGPESVRCDTCKKFFHMQCLNPPLVSKPAKGYSWTCAPCSKRHEQNVELTLQTGGPISSTNGSNGVAPNSRPSNTQGTVRGAAFSRGKLTAGIGRGRGRPPGSGRRNLTQNENITSACNSPEGTPFIDKTIDDHRGTRCFNRWPYRYFGQHTNALDVLDPHDSVYPIATTRLGTKYQANLPTWEEQQEAGLGTHCKIKEKSKDEDGQNVAVDELAVQVTLPKKKGRPFKRKRDPLERSDTPTTGSSTPTVMSVTLTSEPPEFERGTEHSAKQLFLPSIVDSESTLDAYIRDAQAHFKTIPPHNVDLLNRALEVFTMEQGDPVKALAALSQSTPEDLHIVNWTTKELKQFEIGIKEVNSDMKQLRKYILTKKVPDIVRYFVVWKMQRIKADLQAQEEVKLGSRTAKKTNTSATTTAPSKPSTSRAVSPSLSVYGDESPSGPSTSCAMCSITSSPFWYKGPASLTNRVLCVICGLHWRKYAAETFNPELVSVNTRNKTAAAAAAAEDGLLGVARPTKVARLSRDTKAGTPVASPGAGAGTNATAATVPLPKPEPLKCVMCRRIEPKKKLAQCRQCSLSVHQGCYGLTDEEIMMDYWTCDPCNNESALEVALLPKCILCSPLAQQEAAAISAKQALATSSASGEKGRGRPKLSLGGSSTTSPMPDKAKTVALGKKDAANGVAVTDPIRSAPLGALDAFKPTECNNWAHVLCAVWMPDVVFSDANRLKMVENSGHLPTWRYEAICTVCGDRLGACVTCSEASCRKSFHVSCAYNQQPGYTLGFEIIPVKGSRREVISTLTFKGETGHMVPQIWCREHKEIAKTKKLYDLAEVDPKTALTALQMFVRLNKHLQVPANATANTLVGETTYALLRRAKRFDSLLGATPGLTAVFHRSPTAAPLKTCFSCHTQFSPFWWHIALPDIKAEPDSPARPAPQLCCNYCKETKYKHFEAS